MKTRTALALLLIGTAIITSGGLFKIMHWPSANIQLVLGTLMQVAALLALAAKVRQGGDLNQLLEK
jgi:hypothetical protein